MPSACTSVFRVADQNRSAPTQIECVREFAGRFFRRRRHRPGWGAAGEEAGKRSDPRWRGKAASGIAPVLEANVTARFGFHRIDREGVVAAPAGGDNTGAAGADG